MHVGDDSKVSGTAQHLWSADVYLKQQLAGPNWYGGHSEIIDDFRCTAVRLYSSD